MERCQCSMFKVNDLLSVKLTPPANRSPPLVMPAAPTATFSLTTIIAFSKRTSVPRRSSVCTMRTARTMLAASYLARCEIVSFLKVASRCFAALFCCSQNWFDHQTRRWLASATSTLLPHLQLLLRLAQGPESAPMLLMLSRWPVLGNINIVEITWKFASNASNCFHLSGRPTTTLLWARKHKNLSL